LRAVRRRLGLLLCVIGIVAVVVGTASGCGSLFSFNGRHAIAAYPLTPGAPLRSTFPAKEGKRYTLAIQVVFEREGLDESKGQGVVEAQLPIVASIEDTSGVAVVRVVGFIDPHEPPTLLLGRGASGQRHPPGMPPAELVAERLVGPYTVAAARAVRFSVDLGKDRIGRTAIREARLALYDDSLPRSVTIAFAGAAAGLLALITGSILLLFGLVRARRGGARRVPAV
jgi:hypothetical protein